MNNWEKKFDELEHREGCIFYGDIVMECTCVRNNINSFIESLLSKQREEILGKIKKFNTKNHICRFNDGESNCECYNQALSDIEKEI